jgi:hypothetical protein
VLEQLAKLACRSAQLRRAVLQKQAGLAGAALKTLGGAAAKHPVMAALGGLGAVQGGAGAVGKYREHKSGFDPAVQQAMLGQPPVPPGA